MRHHLMIIAIATAFATAAAAQSTWEEYSYPDKQFAVSFPTQPTVTTMPFMAANGATVTQTIYSVQQDTASFRVAVIDLSSTGIDSSTAINQAVAAFGARGDVKLDIEARVQANYGRYLNIAGNDGSHSIAAVFFGSGRLYQIEGTVPASNPDALSGEMIRFQQSLRFMGDAARGR